MPVFKRNHDQMATASQEFRTRRHAPSHEHKIANSDSNTYATLFSIDCLQVHEHRGALRITYPMAHGIVESWSDMERVWSHVYDRDNLNVPPEEHPVLLTEAPLNPYKNRQKCAEVSLALLIRHRQLSC
jgi:actin-related protein